MPLVEYRGFSFDLESLPRPAQRPHPAGHPELAAESHWRSHPAQKTCQAIADLLRDRDLIVLSDEIYSRMCYAATPVSIASFPGMLEKTIILDGFSKTYAMTGWRMGYGVMPAWLVEAMTQADGELELLHRQFHAARRNRRPRADRTRRRRQ